MNARLDQLPDVSKAKFPASYEAAKLALEKCSRTDECQQWAKKAEALASYAKQADDQSLRKMADRIQARAIRRCGELLKKIAPKHTGRPEKNGVGARPNSRKTAAADAGMSEHQRKTALRVASVEQNSFENQVESENPPTVTALAKQGRKPLLDLGEVKPADFAIATQALAHLRRLSEFAKAHDPVMVAGGVMKSERKAARAYIAAIDSWVDRFVTSLGD